VRRLLAVLSVLLAFVATSCKPNQDATDLRNDITKSSNLQRSFDVHVATADAAYSVQGKLEDDLRYSMLLSSGDGKPLVDYVVHDDELAVRLRDPAFGSKLANVLGDPVVDHALKGGQWVQDPSGAPPIIQASTLTGAESSGNPFQDARQVFLFAGSAMGQASQVIKFSLEDITYKSRFDPWRYPGDKTSELRYDLRPPPLPHSEAQTVRGAGGDIGPQNFRKMSMFVKSGRVDQVCEVIDIVGNEDFIALKQRGLKSNPFLASLFDRVIKGDTAIPIRPKYMVVDVDYPSSAPVNVSSAAVPGKLTVFLSALQQAIGAGALKPAGQVNTTECLRPAGKSTNSAG
jgi:hypothetical protein